MTIAYPNIDPVAFSVFGLPIRWYALSYIFGLGLGWYYLQKIMSNVAIWPNTGPALNKVQLEDIVFWVAIGVLAGGRIGYVVFYEPQLLTDPWVALGANMQPGLIKTLVGWVPIPPALRIWGGGMSFHGGLIGVTTAGYLFCRKHALNPLEIGDMFAAVIPIGLFLGRVANFINGELYGRPWNGPWAMVFPQDPLSIPRHPSQLYEAALEGLVLFAILRFATHGIKLLKTPGATIGVFLVGYSSARIFVENFRQPDTQLPDFPFGLTMGMMLSTPMAGLGAWLIYRARKSVSTSSTP
ncbi:MAG: prolipoprotein diacylglyceryl transferase [Pseudomonadota bacterium]